MRPPQPPIPLPMNMPRPSMPRALALCALLLVLALTPGVGPAQDNAMNPPAGQTGSDNATLAALAPPDLLCRSAILVDAATGEVLFEKDADLAIPPASITKLMTLHLALNEVDAGRMDLNEHVDIGDEAWAANFPARASLMFLEPGQRVTLKEIMLGLAVCSGNDAAVALAMHMAGSVDAFVARMNQEAAALGLVDMHFEDPSGLSSRNLVTAREFAAFCRVYVAAHPWALAELHAVREFAYPQPRNLAPGSDQAPIAQENRNRMLWAYPGVDGLKTGYIRGSGYNVALTAERDGTRLIAVLMGGPGETHAQGSANQVRDATLLLEYGFCVTSSGP